MTDGMKESVIRLLDIALTELDKINKLWTEMFEVANKK